MYLYHTASTSDYSNSISNPANPNLPCNPLEAPIIIDTDFPIDDTITTGWSASSLNLFANGIISLLWGVALAIFASGVVPVDWVISQYGKNHPDIINALVALIGTASTTHIKYTFQGILDNYSYYVLVNGFTLNQLTWMQGIKEWSLSTVAALESQKKRVAWLVLYGGMALHSASVVSVLQPNTFYKTISFNNPIPCGTDPNNISLGVADNLPQDIQSQIDQLSYGVGLQVGNYVAQVSGNTTTSVAGRVYVKDNYGYGAIGSVPNGLQEVPGVSFNARCSSELNTPDIYPLWDSAFPGRTPPLVIRFSNGSQIFSDQPISSQMRSIVSDSVLNFKGSEVGMYALLNTSGSGGILMFNGSGLVLGCVWQVMPKLVFVRTVNYTAQSLDSQDSKEVPQLTGRAVLLTLEGMAKAIHFGARIDVNNDLVIRPQTYALRVTPTSAVLQALLADGGKAAFTMFNDYFSSRIRQQKDLTGVAVCNNNNRNSYPHWKFGNQYNLGWIAIIWTTGMGVLAIVAAMWFAQRPGIRDIKPLEVTYAFGLARVVIVDGMKKGNQVLRIRNVRSGKVNTIHGQAGSVSRSRTI